MDNNFIILGEININSLLKAKQAFDKALKEAKTELERDGAIQRFEFTYRTFVENTQTNFGIQRGNRKQSSRCVSRSCQAKFDRRSSNLV
jgi:hypothetical protein